MVYRECAYVRLNAATPTGYILLFCDKNGKGFFPENSKPKPIVLTERQGRKCGSGPYFKQQWDPYLSTYECRVSSLKADCDSPREGFRKTTVDTAYVLTDDVTVLFTKGLTNWALNWLQVKFTKNKASGFVQSVQLTLGVVGVYGPRSLGYRTIDATIAGITCDEWKYCFNHSWDSVCAQLNKELVAYGRKTFNPDNWAAGAQDSFRVTHPSGTDQIQIKCNSWVQQYTYGDITFNGEWIYDHTHDNYDLWDSLLLGIIPGSIRNEVAEAYQNSGLALPEVSANSIMNVMELASSLTTAGSAVKRGAAAIKRLAGNTAKSFLDPRNSWLAWRYVYNTTKMDLEEYKSVTNRLTQIATAFGETFKTSGTAITADGARIKCTETWKSSDFDVTDFNTLRLLKTYGFKLSAYNAWDMIPYSFMVDWFIPVGDMLKHSEDWAHRRSLKSQQHWFSYYRKDEHGFTYFRWSGPLPYLEPKFTRHSVSGKTITYRVADTISIFT